MDTDSTLRLDGRVSPDVTISKPRAPSDWPFIMGLLATLAWAAEITTQFVAARFGNHARLGPPVALLQPEVTQAARWIFGCLAACALVSVVVRSARWMAASFAMGSVSALAVASGRVYAPIKVFIWYAAYSRVRANARIVSPIFARAWVIFIVSALVGCVALNATLRRRRRRGTSIAHGSAAWGNGTALMRPSGLAVGRGPRGRLLRYAGEGHLVTLAPTRAGKGVSAVIPNLLTYDGSIVATDVKPELYAVTARARAGLGQQVFVLDPFEAAHADRAHEATLNPFDAIDQDGPDAVDDVRLLSDMIVTPESKETGEQAFWHEEARALLAGLMLHVVTSAPRGLRTLPYVRTLLTSPPEAFEALLAEMLASQAANGIVSRAAARLLQKAEKERSGVVSTAQSFTHWLDSQRMLPAMGVTTPALGKALANLTAARATIYLVLPPERLETYAAWLRLAIGCVILGLTRSNGSRNPMIGTSRTLVLLDEFAAIGRMRPVERGIALAAGFGASFWIVLQDLGQLQATYPDRWRTVLANAHVLQAFGANDLETCEHLSKLTGQSTVAVVSENASAGVSRGKNGQRQESSAFTESETGRALLLPDEVRRLAADRELLFVAGQPPLLARRLDYRRDREFHGLADANPQHPTPPPQTPPSWWSKIGWSQP